MVAPLVLAVSLVSAPPADQTPVPQPFPRPGPTQPAPPASQPPPTRPAPPPIAAQPPATQLTRPTASMLGLPLYPGAQFIVSYDAGRGQRYYLFGSAASFADLVNYYRNALL